MKAMILNKYGERLIYKEVSDPTPKKGQILLRVLACGVCRTDLHIIDRDINNSKFPLILGHEIVGEVIGLGTDTNKFSIGDRVGVPWLGWSCGDCYYCKTERENLCDRALFTGYQIDGGFAEMTVAYERFCFKLDNHYSDMEAAPLLCAGLIGYRAYRMSNNAKRLGIYGFGAAAHIITQIAKHQGSEVFAFTREDDIKTQTFAKKLGAIWAGSSKKCPLNYWILP